MRMGAFRLSVIAKCETVLRDNYVDRTYLNNKGGNIDKDIPVHK